MNIIDLEILKEGFNYIDEAYGALMCKSAIVAFESQGHSSEVILKVNTANCTEFEKDARKEVVSVNFTNFKVLWTTKIDELTLRSYRDENRTTDFGAMAIALLLTLQLTDYDTILFTEGFNPDSYRDRFLAGT